MCTYLVAEHKVAPVEALKLFEGIYTAKYVKDPEATYCIEVIDYLEAIEFAIQKGWYDYKKFDATGYLHYNNFNNGDINWIVPNFILAFSGPTDDKKTFGPANSVELALTKLRECGVNTIIRLNEEEYDRNYFIENGIDHVDLIFEDGTVPDEVVILLSKENYWPLLLQHPTEKEAFCSPLQGWSWKNRYAHRNVHVEVPWYEKKSCYRLA